MRRFGRVTCCGGETRLLFRFVHLHVCSTEWQWCLPTPPLTVQYCYLLATSAACLHSLIYIYIYIYSNHLIYSRLTHWAPPRMSLSMCTAAHWGMLQHNELCTPWHICLFCFSAIFSNYVCCWIYSRYSRALFHRCVSQHVRVQRLVLSVLAETGLNPGSQWQRGWACLRSLDDFVHEAVTHRKDSAAT